MSEYVKEDEEVNINEPIVLGDLSDQELTDVMEPHSKVPFIIKKASVRKRYLDNKKAPSEDNPWSETLLVVESAIGPEGVDGEGKYKNKRMFPELPLAFSIEGPFKERAKSDWWMKKRRAPTVEFFIALGYTPDKLPNIDTELLKEILPGREYVADIKKNAVQAKTGEKDDKGKDVYKDTGDFRNELGNFRKAAGGDAA